MTNSNLTFYKNELVDTFKEVSDSINSLRDLRIFMEHHVYLVWNFMCVVKSLQHHVSPSGNVWFPTHGRLTRIINEILLFEESDKHIIDDYSSHFNLYIEAMTEIGANTEPINNFLRYIEIHGINEALELPGVPKDSKEFLKKTVDVINTNEVHKIAAVVAHSKEIVAPALFKHLLTRPTVIFTASKFKYYLERNNNITDNYREMTTVELSKILTQWNIPLQLEAEETAIDITANGIKFWKEVYRWVNEVEISQ